MLIRAGLAPALVALLALAACGAPGEPERQSDLTPRDNTVAVVGTL